MANYHDNSIDLTTQQFSHLEINNTAIELPTHHQQQTQLSKLIQENIQLKLKNQAFKNQVIKFQQTLNKQIEKKLNQRKNQRLIANQLKNVYRKCQIYKKQIKSLRKRQQSLSQIKTGQYYNLLVQAQKEKIKLKQQIKILKKISKMQQKGLIQQGYDHYMKISLENQKLKSENKKMRVKLDDYERIMIKQQSKRNRKPNYQIKKTIQSGQEYQSQKYQKDLKIYKSMQEKDNHKIKQLAFQKNRLVEICENLKMQLSQRDKQIQNLKHKMIGQRRLIQNSSRSKHTRIKTENIQTATQHQQFQEKKLRSNDVIPQEIIVNKNFQNLQKSISLYPRSQFYGDHIQNGIKWNDSTFSSYIKQFQIIPHQEGHIKYLHVRYKKGEAKKIKGQYCSFICEQNNQYIKQIRGGFKDKYLQYLEVVTNQKRKYKFCRYDLESQCENFNFSIKQNQYPASLYGEYQEGGVTMIGCLIQKQKKKI